MMTCALWPVYCVSVTLWWHVHYDLSIVYLWHYDDMCIMTCLLSISDIMMTCMTPCALWPVYCVHVTLWWHVWHHVHYDLYIEYLWHYDDMYVHYDLCVEYLWHYDDMYVHYDLCVAHVDLPERRRWHSQRDCITTRGQGTHTMITQVWMMALYRVRCLLTLISEHCGQ